LLSVFWARMSMHVAPRHRAGRLKQWLNYLRRHYPEAQQAFDVLRLVQDPTVLAAWLSQPLAKFEQKPQLEALSS